MEIRQLKYFLTLARQEHMSHAADMLNISQPALSRSIASLEKEIGVPLFERIGNHIELNDNGRDFAVYANQALDSLNKGVQSARSLRYDTRGVLRIAFHAFADNILDCLDEYTRLNPHVQLRLFQTEMADSHLADNVDFILSTDKETLSYSANSQNWSMHRLWDEAPMILISPRYRRYPDDVTEIPLSSLKEDLFTGDLFSPMFYDNFATQLCAAAGFTPHFFSFTDDFSLGMHFVGIGKAICIVPAGCVRIARQLYPDLRSFAIKDCPRLRTLYILRKKDSLLDEAGLDFWDFFTDYYQLN